MSLFGFDVIIPTKRRVPYRMSDKSIDVDSVDSPTTGSYPENGFDNFLQNEYVVIDVNFFPSYKEVTDFPCRLRSFLRNKAGI